MLVYGRTEGEGARGQSCGRIAHGRASFCNRSSFKFKVVCVPQVSSEVCVLNRLCDYDWTYCTVTILYNRASNMVNRSEFVKTDKLNDKIFTATARLAKCS